MDQRNYWDMATTPIRSRGSLRASTRYRPGQGGFLHAAVLVVLLVGLVGCGSAYLYPVDYNERLERRVGDLAAVAKSAKFADLTDFEWDEVYVFSNYESGQMVNETVGIEILQDGDYITDAECLLVYMKDGELLKVEIIHPGMIASGHGTSDALIVPSDVGYKPAGL